MCLLVLNDVMEEIQNNPILEFNPNQLQDVRKAVGYEDVNKLKQDIQQLQEWIKKQNHFKVKDFGMLLLSIVSKFVKKYDLVLSCRLSRWRKSNMASIQISAKGNESIYI